MNKPLPHIQTFDELLRWRAQTHPERRLYTFLANGEDEEGSITFGELDRRARAVAAQLQSQIEVGARALLLYPPGIEYIVGFFGCLYAGVVAVPAYPPDPARLSRTLPRLQTIAADAQASLILTITPILQMAQFLFAQAPDLAARQWLATDGLDETLADTWKPGTRGSDTLAFLQYTSGSTQTPKGVMLNHRNLLHNAAHAGDMMELTPESRLVSWLPPYHDMGLIGMILQPVYRGFPAVLMSPVDFLKAPLRWLRAVTQYQATVTGGPNFAYDLCVRKFNPDREPAPLDLSHLRVLFNGAEPIRPDTLENFSATFSPYGFRREAFYPCYGLAEGTLIASGVRVAEPPAMLAVNKTALAQGRVVLDEEGDRVIRLAGSGHSLSGQTLMIVDPDSQTVASPGQIGEIWVSGPSVAQGYWNRPQETAASFAACLADTGDGPFLRTGDLGFLHEGELYVTGRRKDLVIIHGQNHYPQDIEWTAERCHPALRPGCGAAFSVDVGGTERLVVVQEVNPLHDSEYEAVMQRMRQAVNESHELQLYGIVLIEPRAMLKTSSGKVQRFACRQAFLEGSLPMVAQSLLHIPDARDPESNGGSSFLQDLLQSVAPDQQRKVLLSFVRHQLAELLGLNPAQLNSALPLSTYGINSVQAVELSQRFEISLGRELPATLAYDYPTLDALCDYLLKIVLATPGQGLTDGTASAGGQPLTEIGNMSEKEAELALLRELEQFNA